ncbi:filamentous hemagglutinin outer membrane protein [Caballeronia arvi]|uniref:Filamentous hemagglutinin outer membrane protein n=1 Tax=Caballeronia arvi TaxID=1777135 RepID=A0A158J568_9BURK|nr:hemagglutinin repeat-containing protein [Caballeronia arvi]SAL64007.1 filamentous hemagglutinin outer membrane protein [Caballeronia arvi]
MNKYSYKLVFSRVRHMFVAVADFAMAHGNGAARGEGAARCAHTASIMTPVVRAMALAAMSLFGTASTFAVAQIVAAPGSGAQVIQTQNGLNQVNIARPSAAGVSMNTYSQFDVPGKGAILNNSPTITQTQQAGYINGNANLTPGQEARVIVNQVMSNSPSQLRGYLEVAGPRSEVIVANPNGIVVDGGGFINTSRAILTTGTPNFGPNGSLAGFNVSGGSITVQGAGLNATSVDQVDLLARAIQVNAAIYANNLSAVAGANQVDHDTLAATPIGGNGAAPSLAIDVSALGGMYANRIYLASNEYGVGVSTRGVLAAQAGDLTLQSNGQLVLAGQTNARGSISAQAAGGIDNSGVTYAQRDVIATTGGALTNSGTLAAQQNATVNARSVASTGTLGAGVNTDGSIAPGGDLNLIASGALSATGRNAAGGNAVLQGASVNLAGSSTTANGNLGLTATAGDVNLSTASTTAGGAINANATGSFTNDNGALKSGGAQTITASALSNRNGQIIAGGALTESIAGAIQNQGGTMQAAGALTTRAGSLDNSAGHLSSLNADGLSLTVTGLLNNGQGGTIGGNGSVIAQAGQLVNAGSITAVQDLVASTTQTLTNTGTLAANGNATASAGTTLANSGTLSAGRSATLKASTLDNSNGAITGDQLSVTATNFTNRNGRLTQTGAGATTLAISNTLDNASGTIATNAQDLTLAPAVLINDHGRITASGTGTLSIATNSLSNNGGTIATNGALAANVSGAASNQSGTLQAGSALSMRAGSLDNTGGSIAALGTGGVALTVAGLFNNGSGGTIGSNGNIVLQAGQLVNAGSITTVQSLIVAAVQSLFNSGTLASNGTTSVSAGTTLTNTNTIAGRQLAVSAFDLVNRGSITQAGTAATTFTVSGTLDNTSGTIQTNADDLTLAPAVLVNDRGTITSSGTGTLSVNSGSVSNNGGTIATNGALDMKSGALSNQGGTLSAQTSASLDVASLDNRAGYVGAQNVSVSDAGTLDNTGGTMQANGALDVSAQDVRNDGGSISNGGTGASTVQARGALSNTNNGVIGGNGDVSVSGASIDNSGGTFVAGGSIAAHSDSTFANRAGLVQGGGDASIAATGAIDNTGGQIEADGANSALSVSGASLDNSNGRIANSGAGAMNVSAGSIVNSNTNGVAGAGTIGGNGDVTLDAQALSNTNGAQVLAGHDLTLNIAQWADNTNGTLSGANNVTLNGPNAALVNASGSIHGNGAIGLNTASIDNANGRIGNDQGSGGSVSIATGTLANQNGAIGSDQDLSVRTNMLTGDGRIVAGRDGTVTIDGDYTLDGANLIQANHDLTLTTSGTFTNQGMLAAVNALNVNAYNVDNQAGADLNAATTTVNAANAISNEGRIEGDSVTTTSATLVNTATIIGNIVTLTGTQSIVNDGAAAVMAAASELNLYSRGDIGNTNGANIFSLVDIVIAGDATRDADGLLTNRANTVTNDQSTIEALSNIEVAANTLNNTRPAPAVETVETSVETKHETKRARYFGCTTTGNDDHANCSNADYNGPYQHPLDVTYSDSDVVSTASGPNAVDRVLVVNIAGTPTTIYYNTLTQNADGTISVSYWDAYDPHINYDPATEYPSTNDAHNGWQRVELARDTTTTTQEDRVVSGAQAQQAQLLAGGTMTLANVGTINNAYSAIAAGDAIQIGNAVQNGELDTSGNGSVGGTIVNNIGQTLYRYQRQDIESTYTWNEDPNRDVGPVTQPSIVLAPVAIGGTGGTIIANNLIDIRALDVNNVNVAAASSATGATGGTLGANAAMTSVAGASGANVNAAGGASVDGANGAATQAATGSGARIDAPQSVAGPTGALNIPLPTSGLYHYNTAPDAAYLIATDPRLTSYTSFISSDYMLKALDLDPSKVIKRLGDGVYEQQLIRNQITQLTGRVYLQGYTSNEDEYRALMTNGVNVAKAFGLVPGMALTAAQMDALTSDIVWLVEQTVTLPDGSVQHALAPVVYLAHAHANDLQPTGALIAADDVEIHTTGSVSNSGVINGGTKTVISATDILNRGGTIGSSSANGTTVISATNDITNASGRITGNRVAVLAGHDVVNTTLVDAVGVSSAAGDSRVQQTLIGAQGTIDSTGDMLIAAGHDLTVHGATISAGGKAQITAGHDVLVDTVQSETSQSVTKNADHHWEAHSTINETSGISAGGSLSMQSGNDMTFKGAKVSAGGDLSAVAGGNLTATTVTDSQKLDNVATDDRVKRIEHYYDEQAQGTTFSAGGKGTLAALSTDESKGNVTLTGSTLSTDKGAASIAATGDVTLNEAREEHDSFSYVHSERGSFVSKTTEDDSVDIKSNDAKGSLVSGNTVAIIAGKDITVQGSDVVATHDMSIAALGNVNITAAQNQYRDVEQHEVKTSGISGSGGIGVSIGSSEQKAAYDSSAVTESQSRSTIGSVQGNVSIKAGKDLHIGGSDIVAGRAPDDIAGAGGNIALKGQNVTIDPGRDNANSHEHQEASSSGVAIGIAGTPFDTARNVKAASASGNGYQRAKGIGNELAASPLDTPSVTATFSHSSSSATIDASSLTNSGSTIRGAGNVSVTATGGALMDANGHPLDGDITVTGSTITAGGTAKLDANRNVTLQASTDQMQQSNQSESSSSSLQIASPSLGDVSRWVNGGPNSSGVSSSPYNAASGHSNANGSSSTQTASVVTGNNVTLVSHTGDINVIGSGIVGTQGVDLLANQGSINVLAGIETSTSHLDESRHQFGDLGSNGVGTGFSQGVSNSHRTQDDAAQTQSTIRSQIVSGNGSVTAVAKNDINVQGADLVASKDLTLMGRNVNLDAGADATQSQMSQSSSQYGVTFALGGVAGDTVATVNRNVTAASQTHDKRLAALEVAQAGLAGYGASAAAASGNAPLIKATVSVGGGSSQSEAQSDAVAHAGSTLTGKNVTIVAAGSGAKDAAGYASDGDINSRGTTISGENVTMMAARDVNLLSAQDMSRQSGSNSSSNASIGVGLGLGGQQNGFTLELAASGTKGHMNGNGVTHVDTQVNASDALTIASGRDTNLIGAEAAGRTVNVDVGRNLTITSPQDTNAYDSQQKSAGMQASICVPPFCVGQTVSGGASVSETKIDANYESVNRQSGLFAGEGGFNVNVREHTQLDGGAIASTAAAQRNTLSTGTFGFSDVQNHADYSGSSIGFSASTTMDKGASAFPGIAGIGPTGFGVAGTSGSASGTTHAVVSAGTITVRDDALTGHDSTAGLSRDAANANGSVLNSFDAQKVADDMAVQQAAVQVGMTVAGDVADSLAKGNPSLWGTDGAGRIALHGAVAAAGAALGGGNVAGAIGGTIAGDLASGALNTAMGAGAGATLAGNVAAGAAGAAVGGLIGGAGGAMSGANGALGADLYNNQGHRDKPDERPGHENTAGNDVTDTHLNILPTAGGAMSKDAQPDTFTVGGGVALPATGLPTDWESVTKGFSTPNAAIGLTREEFERNLLNSGFTATPLGGENDITLYRNGDVQYTVRNNASSTGGPSVDYRVGNKTISKIRLK